MSASPEVESPCTKVCTLDPSGRLCLGCFRDIDEIGRWGGMSNAERAGVIAQIAGRRAQFESGGAPTGSSTACRRCGAGFSCGANDATRPCWCTGYPAVTPSAADATCLCPACLAAAAAP